MVTWYADDELRVYRREVRILGRREECEEWQAVKDKVDRYERDNAIKYFDG